MAIETHDVQTTMSEVIRQAALGNACAFETLYDAYRSRLFHYFFHDTSDQASAEELTQSFFVKLWRVLPRYQDRGLPFTAWLYRLAHNHLMDHFRSQRRCLSFNEPLDTALGRCDEHADRELQRSEDGFLLRRALATLRPKQREVVVMRFFQQLSTCEIAAALGMTEGAVRVQQMRALQALRRELDGQGVNR